MIPFDIVILAKKADFNKLKYLLPSIKKNILGYENIYIISDEKLPNDNNEFINYTDYEIIDKKYKDKLKYRPNWIFQQFIKLFQNVTKNDYYLVIDADVYISSEIKVFDYDSPLFFLGIDQNNKPYFKFSEAFNIKKLCSRSFISEIMLMNKTIIKEFLNSQNLDVDGFLEKSCEIIDEDCYISEYELYGNMVLKFQPFKYDFRFINVKSQGIFSEWSDKQIEKLIYDYEKHFDLIVYHTFDS
jgi:hypothetical protein